MEQNEREREREREQTHGLCVVTYGSLGGGFQWPLLVGSAMGGSGDGVHDHGFRV